MMPLLPMTRMLFPPERKHCLAVRILKWILIVLYFAMLSQWVVQD